MSSFKDFLQWYNKKDVVPTFEAMQKMNAFYHDKDIDMFKLDCTLSNVAKICLHKSTNAKFCPWTKGDKKLLQEIREIVVGGPSIVFTRKAVVDENYLQKSTNICKSIIGTAASELYPYSMSHVNLCPLVFKRVRISTQEPLGSQLDKTRPVVLKIWSYPIFNKQDLILKLRKPTLQADRTKLTASVMMGFVLIAILSLKQWVAFLTFVPVKICVHLSLKKVSNVAVRKENSMN